MSLRKQIGYRQVSLLKSAARQSECISNLELDINKITQKITFSLKKNQNKQTTKKNLCYRNVSTKLMAAAY